MERYDHCRIRLPFGSEIGAEMLFVGFAVAIVLGGSNAYADFTLGTPTNLGPVVNTSYGDADTCLSMDMLELYFDSDRPGGSGNWDLWVARRTSKNDDWTQPVNLGPTINSSAWYHDASISADKLLLLFGSNRSGGHGGDDIWATKRATIDDDWSTPENLGAKINSSNNEMDPALSADGLQLYFCSQNRPGGYGSFDIFVSTRTSLNDDWGQPVNLGPLVNTSYADYSPSVSADGLTLFFCSERPGGYGDADLWVTRRPTTNDEWGEPINLGSSINSLDWEGDPDLSSDGSVLLFTSDRPGGYGSWDAWQTQIEPICDLDNDLKVDLTDMHIMVDHWGENYPLCDIGPTPLGDGIVDIKDMIVLTEHFYGLIAHWKLDETDGSIAYDNSGDYDGTLHGNPLWQPAQGRIGGSLLFDGIDDYVETPFILDPTKESFSIFAWINCWTPGQAIISQSNTASARGVIPGSSWLGTDPSEGKLVTGFSDISFGTLESESIIIDFQWHHVGFVYDMDSLQRRLYVDGIQVAEDTSVVSGSSSGGGLYIGASKDLDAGSLFSGFVDDVRIYKQALGAKEIAALAH